MYFLFRTPRNTCIPIKARRAEATKRVGKGEQLNYNCLVPDALVARGYIVHLLHGAGSRLRGESMCTEKAKRALDFNLASD